MTELLEEGAEIRKDIEAQYSRMARGEAGPTPGDAVDRKFDEVEAEYRATPSSRAVPGLWIAFDRQNVARSIFHSQKACEEDAKTYADRDAAWRIHGPYVLADGEPRMSLDEVQAVIDFERKAERARTIEECAKAIEDDCERVHEHEGMMLGDSCIYAVCAITVRRVGEATPDNLRPLPFTRVGKP